MHSAAFASNLHLWCRGCLGSLVFGFCKCLGLLSRCCRLRYLNFLGQCLSLCSLQTQHRGWLFARAARGARTPARRPCRLLRAPPDLVGPHVLHRVEAAKFLGPCGGAILKKKESRGVASRCGFIDKAQACIPRGDRSGDFPLSAPLRPLAACHTSTALL